MALSKQTPTDLDQGLDPHVHAIGTVALQWNMAEIMLEELIWLYLEVDTPTGRIITRSLNANAKVELLRQIVELKEADQTIHKYLLHAMECFNLCRENRNHLVHGVAGNLSEKDALQLIKFRRNKPIDDNVFEVTSENIRKIAKEIYECYNYISKLKVVVSMVLVFRQSQNDDDGDHVQQPQLEMPEQPKLPNKLTPLSRVAQN